MSQRIELTAGITAPVNAAETAIASINLGPALANPPLQPLPVGVPTLIAGVINITPGTTTSAVVIRVRQGIGTGGALVGNADTYTLAAGNTATIPFQKVDPVGALSYTITVTQTAGAANGTINSLSVDFDQNLAGRA